jgi:Peptidase A4 family
MTGIRVVAVVAGIAMALAGCGGSAGSSRHEQRRATTSATGAAAALHPDLGPFAGYVWRGDVASAHADWTVPRVLPGSVVGEAATWVGAEAPGPQRAAPFVQIGVNEGNTDGGSPPFYYAFYSTTTLHFHPVHLFDVSPGDQVSATLHQHGGQWQIAFVDRTLGRQRQLAVTEGAGTRFNEAQFTQEDVTDARTSRPFPYPALSPVRFTAVAANGVAPRPAQLTSNWLTEAGGYLAPGPLRDDAFMLSHTRMTTAGYRYLRAIAAQDGATATAFPQLLRWAQGEPAPRAVPAARHFSSVLRVTVGALGDERWPQGARAKVAALRVHARALIALLSRIPSVTAVGRAAWAVRFGRLAELVGADGQAARRALRLPSPMVPASAD